MKISEQIGKAVAFTQFCALTIIQQVAERKELISNKKGNANKDLAYLLGDFNRD